jgi:putative PIN family toxin of toxin-antitoxin system
MKSIVFDTNVLLDLFVFNDFRAIHLKQALLDKKIDALASSKTLEEFTDVISRPLFSLEPAAQEKILAEWRSLARLVDEQSLLPSPWRCQDQDDQVFLDLAFTAKPCILMSKDNEVLKFTSQALKENVLITANYNMMDLQHD